ncbi:MAG: PD-(D/E)XK motif protein, partial [Actinomycetota bacterium]|nr:PD-(D/E)XK motif protein [Actinomycetota bacterium]
VGDSPAATYIDLACTDTTLLPAFAAVAVDLHAAVGFRPQDAVGAVAATLRSWRWFWTVDAAGLSGETALGLFTELWFLERWLGLPKGVAAWVGPTGHRHDFVTPTASIEAKGTRIRSDGGATHRIANLDQLDDPETGHLWLFSLRVVADPLAANTLPGVIERIADSLGTYPDALLTVRERLAQAGWTPAHANRYLQPWRVVAEELYRVGDGFPRLTRNTFPKGVPPGVGDVTYTVDLAACTSFKVASAPGQVGF